MTDEPPVDTGKSEPPPTEWCHVQIMGHVEHYGRAAEATRFGASGILVEVPTLAPIDPAGEFKRENVRIECWEPHFYASAAIYGVSRSTEDQVMYQAMRQMDWRPPYRLQLRIGFDDADEQGELSRAE